MINKYGLVALVGIIVIISFGAGFYTANINATVNVKDVGLTIVDDYGRKVTIPAKLDRIVTISPSTTEIIFAVGLGQKVVGVDEYSDYPPKVKDITKIGSYLMPDLESIVSLDPDIVFVSDMTAKDKVALLEDKDLTVVVLAPNDINGIINDIRLVGVIGGKSSTANDLADEIEQRVNDVISKVSTVEAKPLVYIEYYPYWTYGPGSFGNDLIVMAGGVNIAASTTTSYPQITDEFIVGNNPDIIIYTVGAHGMTTTDEIINRNGWDSINAVKNSNIFTIDDNLTSRPGPRIVDALEELAGIMHPDLFT